jgi:hypothetical protein
MTTTTYSNMTSNMDWRYNTLWFEQMELGKIYVENFKEKTTYDNENKIEKAEYAFLDHLNNEKNPILNLLPTEKILYLDLTWANIKSFECLHNFTALKRLETHYCLKLETDSGLSRFSETLEFLHINQSKKLIFSEQLLQLKKLKVLCLNNCAPIESLDFLKHFPQLIDFRFVDTNVLDGNLNPILDHPSIRTVGFLDKKHYNNKSDKLQLELDCKFENEYKTKVYKGEFMTYRYDYD